MGISIGRPIRPSRAAFRGRWGLPRSLLLLLPLLASPPPDAGRLFPQETRQIIYREDEDRSRTTRSGIDSRGDDPHLQIPGRLGPREISELRGQAESLRRAAESRKKPGSDDDRTETEEAGDKDEPTAEAPGNRAGPFPLSAFERQVEAYGDPMVGRPILQFGYEVFGRPPPLLTDAPVGNDYILGTGDNLIISLWGSADLDRDFRVDIDRDGQVRLPMVGPVALKGLSISRAEAILKKRFDRLYQNYELQLRLGRIRDMPVHVIGRVRSPGRVRVSSVATLFDAIGGAGGVTKDGTLRRILVRREGEGDRSIDLYDYLLEGSLQVDLHLAPNDAVVVPAVGPRVAIVGRVLRPAIYELGGEEITFAELLGSAGGYARLANRSSIQIESVSGRGLSVRTVNLTQVATDQVTLRDGDVVVVRGMAPVLENVVYVAGNVALPGRYAYREGMRVSDIITEDTLVDAGFWIKRTPPSASEETSKLPEPFLEYALIRRIDRQTKQESRITFHLGQAIFEGNPTENHHLQPQDTIVIYPRDDFEAPRTVYITGAVNRPDEYRHYPGMRLLDLVRTAGGLTPEAHLESAILTRIHPEQEGTRFEHIPIDLSAALAGIDAANPVLEHNDALSVKVVPEFKKTYRVAIEGEVRHPGTYIVIPGERLSDVIRRAGGFTEDAYLPAARFYRQSVRKLQQERLDEALMKIETETKLAAQRFTAEAASIADEKIDAAAEQTRIERLITTIRANPAQGRMVVRIRPPGELAGTTDDLELQDQDHLVVPRKPQVVHVVGAVFNQTSLIHQKGLLTKHYLQECGGASDAAEMDLAYIIRADGSADSVSSARKNYQWDGARGRFSRGDLLSSELHPGDTLIVPYDVKPQLSRLGLTKSIIQIIFQAAMSTGLIIALV